MAGGIQQGDDDVISAINITPFVDIVLVLLIIFMVTSNMIARAAVEVDLPSAASGGDSVESTLNIIITKEKELYLNGEVSSKDGITAFIKKENNPKLQAVIAADKGVDYGSVMDIIDLIKVNGVKSFALNVDRSGPPPAKTQGTTPDTTPPAQPADDTPDQPSTP